MKREHHVKTKETGRGVNCLEDGVWKSSVRGVCIWQGLVKSAAGEGGMRKEKNHQGKKSCGQVNTM